MFSNFRDNFKIWWKGAKADLPDGSEYVFRSLASNSIFSNLDLHCNIGDVVNKSKDSHLKTDGNNNVLFKYYHKIHYKITNIKHIVSNCEQYYYYYGKLYREFNEIIWESVQWTNCKIQLININRGKVNKNNFSVVFQVNDLDTLYEVIIDFEKAKITFEGLLIYNKVLEGKCEGMGKKLLEEIKTEIKEDRFYFVNLETKC